MPALKNKDNKYNPGQQEYERNFDFENRPVLTEGIASKEGAINQARERLRNQEDDATARQPASNKASVSEQEATPGWDVNIASPKSSGIVRGYISRKVRNRLLTGGIISMALAMFGIGGGLTLSIPILIKEVGTRWAEHFGVDTSSRRYANFSKRYFNVDESCQGKIRCRFKSGVSDKEIKAFEKANLKPEVGERGGKKFIISLTTQGADGEPVKVTNDNFRETYRDNFRFRASLYTMSKPKAMFWRGEAAVKKFVSFKVNRKNPLGDSEDPKKIQEAARATARGESTDTTIKPGGGDEEDNNSQAAKDLDEVDKSLKELADTDPGMIAEPGKLDGDVASAGAVAKTIASSGLKGAAFSVFAGLDRACSIYQYIRLAVLGAKIYAVAQLIRYATIFMTTADSVKAGEVTPQKLAFMMGILFTPSRLAESRGKTAAQSNLFSLVMQGKVSSKAGLARFVSGSPNLSFMRETLNFLSLAGASASVCSKVKTWYGQLAMLIGGVAISIFSGGTASIAGIAISASLGAAGAVVMAYLTPRIVQYLAGTVAPIFGQDPEGGFGAGNAIVAGLGALGLWQMGKAHGQRPLTKDEYTKVAAQANDENARIAAAENLESNMLDLTNPDSLSGRLALASAPYVSSIGSGNLQQIASLVVSPFSMLTGQANSLLGKASAATDVYRGEYCTDPDNIELNLATDASCNLIYGKPASEIHEPDAVDAYMVDNGFVDDNTGEAKGEFADYIDTCVDGNDPITADGKGVDLSQNINTKQCLETDEKHLMFQDYIGYNDLDISHTSSLNGTLGQENAATAGGGDNSTVEAPGQFAWPVQPSSASTITSCQNVTDASYRQHVGLDIAAPLGTPIVSVADGKVVVSRTDSSGFDYYIAIRHGDGSITGYGHNQTNLVQEGDVVKKGQRIATVGSRGQSTGPHLHINYTKDGNPYATMANSYNILYGGLMPKPANVNDQAGCLTTQKLKPR